MDSLFTPTRVGWAVGIVCISLIARFLQRLHYHRTLVKGLPGPPHSYLFGHIISMGKVVASQPRLAAPQAFPLLLKEAYNLGDYFYVDAWPFNPDPIMMILDADIMSQFTVKQNMLKHPVVDDFMQAFGGPGNLVSAEGAEWKKWRSAFNPGFSQGHLMTLVPSIVDECNIFCEIQTKHARNNDLFRMEPDTTRLTIDIIGKVVLDFPLHSQLRRNEMVDAFTSQTRWLPKGVQFNFWEIIDFPLRYAMREYNNFKMNRYINARLDERFATRESRGKSKAVVDLALDAYLKEKGKTVDPSMKKLDPEFKTAALNNMKTFIFAGHDTTSGTLCYVYYYLSQDPERLAKIRKEHDDVFGPDPSAVGEQLKQDPHLLNRLDYTLAVTREVLRLQPPASSVRVGAKGFFLHDPDTNEALPTENFMLWPVDVGVHRNGKYWPDPNAFIPERHMHDSGDSSANFKTKDAWIAFSKGTRNCIGQELAIIETKVILAMTIRLFDFTPAYDELAKLKGDGTGYPSDTSGVQKMFGEEAYQIQLGAAKPREGMPSRIRLRT